MFNKYIEMKSGMVSPRIFNEFCCFLFTYFLLDEKISEISYAHVAQRAVGIVLLLDSQLWLLDST
jgi:phage gp36-like protein